MVQYFCCHVSPTSTFLIKFPTARRCKLIHREMMIIKKKKKKKKKKNNNNNNSNWFLPSRVPICTPGWRAEIWIKCLEGQKWQALMTGIELATLWSTVKGSIQSLYHGTSTINAVGLLLLQPPTLSRNRECMTFVLATIAPMTNVNVKPDPNPNPNPYTTVNQKPNDDPCSIKLFVARYIIAGAIRC